MKTEPAQIDLETLLQHRGFVRALARSLVRDDARADDVVQETWIAAMKNPPRDPGMPRAWLASVVRKLAWTHARGERRRTEREHKRLMPLPVPAPPELLDQRGWNRRVAAAVMELDEPYRTTLLLRYYEELTSNEIARMQGVPAPTVRTRIRRGLQQLRERFDAEVAGGRERWAMALTPLLALDGAARIGRVKLAALFALALCVGGAATAVWMRHGEQARTRVTQVRADRLAAPAASSTPAEPAVTDGPMTEGAFLHVMVLADGRPAAGARVALFRDAHFPWSWRPRDAWRAVAEATCDAAGHARFDRLAGGYARVVALRDGSGRAETYVHLPQEFEHPVVVELEVQSAMPLRVVADGRPVAGARVQVWGDAGPWQPAAAVAPTDALGRTVVPHARIRVSAQGYAPFGPRETGGVVDLRPLDQAATWSVDAFDGTPLVVRRVHDARGRTVHVAEGRVVVDGLARGTVPELLAIAPNGDFARLADEPRVVFAAPPRLDAVFLDRAGAAVEGLHVRLHDEAGGAAIFPDGVTDAAGRVTLPVYAAGRVQVRVREHALEPFRTVRVYDTAGGEASMEVRLPVSRDVAIHVRMQGRPLLPAAYHVYCDRTRVVPRVDGATLRLRLRPERDREVQVVHLLAPGSVPVSLPVAVSGEWVVDLERAGSLVLGVRADRPYHLELLESLRRGPSRFRLHPGPDDVVRETMLPPGVYRVRDTISGRATAPVRVVQGGVTRAYLDLTDAPRIPALLPVPAAPRNHPSLAFVRLVLPYEPVLEGATAPRVIVAGHTLAAVRDNDRLTFSGFAVGASDVWIDLPGFAPARIEDVEFREGENDLGTVLLRSGSTLRFHVVGRQGKLLPELTISAQALGTPRYQRSLRTRGGADPDLVGLAEGTFQATAWERYTGHRVFSARIAVDGSNYYAVTIDLR